MKLRRTHKTSKKRSRTETKTVPAPTSNESKENMFNPRVAWRVIFRKKTKEDAPQTAVQPEVAQPDQPAEKRSRRDRVLKHLGIVGSIILCVIKLSGATLALAGLLAVIILTIDPNSKLAEILRKISGGKIASKEKKVK